MVSRFISLHCLMHSKKINGFTWYYRIVVAQLAPFSVSLVALFLYRKLELYCIPYICHVYIYIYMRVDEQ